MKIVIRNKESGGRINSEKNLNIAVFLLFSVFCLLNSAFLSSCAKDKFTSEFLLEGERIRVAILKDVKDLKIGGVGAAKTNGHSLDIKDGVITLDDSGALAINGNKVPGSSIRFFPDNGVIYVNGRPFRGKIEVIKDIKGLLVVNELPVEFYLIGIINNEISSKWPMDAVKAQAVAARTYALYQKKKKVSGVYHVEGTVASQVYSGRNAEDDRSFQAVKETWGEALTFDGEFALTVYHSNGGGITEDSRGVWGKDYAYLKSVKSPYDEDAPNCYWVTIITQQSVEAMLRSAGYAVGSVKEIISLYRTVSNRVTRLRIKHTNGDIEMSGEDLRRIIGYEKVKSTMFTVEISGDSFVFKGKGAGHGVGMSQWGAKGMAEKGYTYVDILKHYYPGTRLEKIY